MLATIGGLKKEKALDILHQVAEATQQWPVFAEKSGVSKSQTERIKTALDHARALI